MRTAKEIINEFKAIADNPRKAMDDYKKETAEQIMVCGDTMNDRTMFEAAGLAVAMGNADEEIKAMADDVTLSNDEDGVAVAIEKWVL